MCRKSLLKTFAKLTGAAVVVGREREEIRLGEKVENYSCFVRGKKQSTPAETSLNFAIRFIQKQRVTCKEKENKPFAGDLPLLPYKHHLSLRPNSCIKSASNSLLSGTSNTFTRSRLVNSVHKTTPNHHHHLEIKTNSYYSFAKTTNTRFNIFDNNNNKLALPSSSSHNINKQQQQKAAITIKKAILICFISISIHCINNIWLSQCQSISHGPPTNLQFNSTTKQQTHQQPQNQPIKTLHYNNKKTPTTKNATDDYHPLPTTITTNETTTRPETEEPEQNLTPEWRYYIVWAVINDLLQRNNTDFLPVINDWGESNNDSESISTAQIGDASLKSSTSAPSSDGITSVSPDAYANGSSSHVNAVHLVSAAAANQLNRTVRPFFGDAFYSFQNLYWPIHCVICLVICTLGIFANVTNIIVLTR